MTQQILIETSTGNVLASGKCDLTTNRNYDDNTMYILELEYYFSESHNVNGYYTRTGNTNNFTFTNN